MLKRADLHIHTTASDGTSSAKEVIDKSIEKGLDAIAITDHDNVGSISEALEYSKSKQIDLIPGIELSTKSKISVHVLGYGIDIYNKELLDTIDILKEKRLDREKKILYKLKENNIDLDLKRNKNGAVGRMDIAVAMLEQGFVSSINEAFDLYLGDKGCAYVDAPRLTPLEGVKLIHKAGGYASIAHPIKLYTNNMLVDLIEGLKPYGLDAIEVYYPAHTQDYINRFSNIALKYNLIKTGGSDFHGSVKATQLGDGKFLVQESIINKFIMGGKI